MRIIDIKRKTKIEKRHSKKMGKLTTKTTYVKKHFLGLPVKTLGKYKETYFSELKNYDDCMLFV